MREEAMATKPKSKAGSEPKAAGKAKPKLDDVREGRGKAPGKFTFGKGRFVRTDEKDKPS
jgi:hypothetical protein